MRLKQLTLTGYKTFANKTKFEFGAGITAVIGPNGSGKSNVADAIRWALGEQAFSLLRSKRTDDMIFAGSPKRARASMAEVLMVFDNSDGFFPIEYSEIEIGRRAYRDGTNEYSLNGSRVRLREIGDLLGSSGLAERNYTVIGQGAVDTALSQKAEERRALFEEAAGIISYRDRRDDALRKLAETRHNLERAKDILAEITPRLAQLERQASKVKQYEALTTELQTHQKIWFGHHYQLTRNLINQSTTQRNTITQTVQAARATVAQFDEAANRIREEQTVLRTSLAAVLPQREDARRKAEDATRNLAVMRERAASFLVQASGVQQDISRRAAAMDDLAIKAAHVAAVLFAAQGVHAQKQTELDEAQAAAAVRQAARAELEAQRNQAQQTLMQFSANVTTARNQISSAQQRTAQLHKRIEASAQRNTQIEAQREHALAKLGTLDQQLAQDLARLNEQEAQHHARAQQLEAARTAFTAAQSALAAAEAEEKLTRRMSLFAEMRAQQGTSDLLDLAQKAALPGVRGVLGSFLQVREEDQKAVQAALGEWMTALVIETQHGVKQTRAWLASQHSGRLLALPLDGLRAGDDLRVNEENARANGARPVLDGVSAPEWLRPALNVLAGRVFLCKDFESAQALAATLPLGSVCVTRLGEIVHTSGALGLPAGISPAADPANKPGFSEVFRDSKPGLLSGGTLHTPEVLSLITPEEAKANRDQAAQLRDTSNRELDAARRLLDEATRIRDTFARESANRRNERNNTEAQAARLEESLAEFAGENEQLEQEIAQIDEQAQHAADDAAKHEADQHEMNVHKSAIETQLQETLAGGWLEALNNAHAALASAAEAVRSAEAVKRERLASYADAVKQKETGEVRFVELTAAQENANSQLQLLVDIAAQSDTDMQAVDARLLPIQLEMAAIEARVNDADAKRREAERHLRESESASNAAELELARHQNELENLRERAVDAFTDDAAMTRSVQPEDSAQALVGEQLTFDARDKALELLESLEPVEQLPEGVTERIQQLRNQIKRLGAINYDAQTEFDELEKRAKFMTEQANDLDEASLSLQQVIAELNDVMKATFRITFDAIAAHFQNTFKILFGGGQAKLVLTNPDNIDECGVEIHAQPPGKRPATLALLSGGERSLTATALMFAILRVKPTPFCVLDEVDAALDESNVGRMRNMIESLADSTQFIIITHNRGTVESAATIYGISMGADGASQVLSLRLDEVSDETIGRGKSNSATPTVDAATVRTGAGWVPPQN